MMSAQQPFPTYLAFQPLVSPPTGHHHDPRQQPQCGFDRKITKSLGNSRLLEQKICEKRWRFNRFYIWKPGTKEMLDDMHLRKIDLADEIFVIRSTSGRLLPTGRKNVGGYIGESTKREIAYATRTSKKINYLEL